MCRGKHFFGVCYKLEFATNNRGFGETQFFLILFFVRYFWCCHLTFKWFWSYRKSNGGQLKCHLKEALFLKRVFGVLDEAISILPWIGWLGPFLSWPWSRIRGVWEWIEQKQGREEEAWRLMLENTSPFVGNDLLQTHFLSLGNMTIVELNKKEGHRNVELDFSKAILRPYWHVLLRSPVWLEVHFS